MSNFGESYGRDIRLDIITPSGLLTCSEITDFSYRPTPHTDSFILLDGTPRHNVIPQGGEGSITLKRVDATLEDFWAAFEAAYYAGARQVRGTVTVTVNEPDGSISQFQLQGVALLVEDFGDWKGETAVTQKLKFTYQTFVKIQ